MNTGPSDGTQLLGAMYNAPSALDTEAKWQTQPYWSAILMAETPRCFRGKSLRFPENPILKVLNRARTQCFAQCKEGSCRSGRRRGSLLRHLVLKCSLILWPRARGSRTKRWSKDKTVDENTDTTKQLTQTNKRLVLDDDPTFQQLIARTEGDGCFQASKAGIDQMRISWP